MAKFGLVAVHDGSDTYHLYVEYDGEPVDELSWPSDWPERVDTAFLREQGFKVIKA